MGEVMPGLSEQEILFFDETRGFLERIREVSRYRLGFFSSFRVDLEEIANGRFMTVIIMGKGYLPKSEKFYRSGVRIVQDPAENIERIRYLILEQRPGYRIQDFKRGMVDTRAWVEPTSDAQSTVTKGQEIIFHLEVTLEPRTSE